MSLPPSEDINGFLLLRRFFDRAQQDDLIAACAEVARQAPFFRPSMGDGRPFRVEMTNAGAWGWISDQAGYRYERSHPLTGRAWPEAPPLLVDGVRAAVTAALGPLAAAVYEPQCFLINRYPPDGGRLGLHRDQDERDRSQPIVTLSLGADAIFLAGGAARRDPVIRVPLQSGDALVMAGPARMAYHGIDRLLPTLDAPIGDGSRWSVTSRRVDRLQ